MSGGIPWKEQQREYRRRAGEQAVVGAGLIGAGTGWEAGLNNRLRNKGAEGTTYSAMANATRSVRERVRRLPKGILGRKPLSMAIHGPHTAGMLGSRALQFTGLPMMAFGVKNAIEGKPQRKISVREDVVKPVARRATLAQAADEGRDLLRKRFTPEQERSLDRRRKAGAALSVTGGVLGLSALGLRAPAGAKTALKILPKTPSKARGALVRVADMEDAATKHSNTLGVTAIGTGSLGSFNYASQQKLERLKAPAPVAKRRRKKTDAELEIPTPRPAWANPEGPWLGPGRTMTRAQVRDMTRWRNAEERRMLTQRRRFLAAQRGEASKSVNKGLPTYGWLKRTGEKVRVLADPTPDGRFDVLGRGDVRRRVHRDGLRFATKEQTVLKPAVPKQMSFDDLEKSLVSKIAVRRVFHGTSPRAARKITREGMKESRFGHFGPGVYTTTDRDVATRYARFKASPDHRAPQGWIEGLRRGRVVEMQAVGPDRAKLDQMVSPWGRGDEAEDYRLFSRGQVKAVGTEKIPFTQEQQRRIKGLAVGGAATVTGGAVTVGAARKSLQSDRWLRRNRQHISPRAEAGYRHMLSMKREEQGEAAAQTAVAGLSGWLTRREWQARPRNRLLLGLAGASTLASGMSAINSARAAGRLDRRMQANIRDTGNRRREAGLYGTGRGVDPVDESSSEFRRMARLQARNLAEAS